MLYLCSSRNSVASRAHGTCLTSGLPPLQNGLSCCEAVDDSLSNLTTLKCRWPRREKPGRFHGSRRHSRTFRSFPRGPRAYSCVRSRSLRKWKGGHCQTSARLRFRRAGDRTRVAKGCLSCRLRSPARGRDLGHSCFSEEVEAGHQDTKTRGRLGEG